MSTKQIEALKLALEALRFALHVGFDESSESQIKKGDKAVQQHQNAITAVKEALAEQPRGEATLAQQEPVAWTPIEQMYPQGKAIDILMGDGSILCAVLPQFDGDLWWEGSGTGEKFIDPKYANVTHWRVHDEHTSPPASKPWVGLTDEERDSITRSIQGGYGSDTKVARAIEAKLREKNEHREKNA